MGSGREANEDLAAPLGEWIARGGYHLLTGAGGGVMEAVAKAFCSVPEAERPGLSIGIVRARNAARDDGDGPRAYELNRLNEWVELPIHTHLHTSDKRVHSRNHINVLSADALVVLPGESGTYSELCLAAEYGRRAILHVGSGRVGGRTAAELAAERELAGWLVVAGALEQVAAAVRQALAERGFAP